MEIRVYQAVNPRFFNFGNESRQLSDFHHVATLEIRGDKVLVAEALEAAWTWTNSIEGPWSFQKIPGLTIVESIPANPFHDQSAPGKPAYRSTSVGDIMEFVRAPGESDWYVVANCGFDLINSPL